MNRHQHKDRLRPFGYYAFGVALLTVYGGRVCPFIDTLPVHVWASVLAWTFVLVFVVRMALEPRLVLAAPVAVRGRRQFWFDLALYVGGGVVVAVVDVLAFSFPAAGGLKVLLGCATFGFYMGLDTGLAREREAIVGGDFENGPFARTLPFCSLTRKFSLVASTVAVAATLIISLVIVKDLSLLHELGKDMSIPRMLLGVALEIGFVGAVLLAFSLRVIGSYSRNLRLLFDLQTSVLAAVGQDDLARKVPVVTDDEFGAVAEHTNTMIDGLREKRRIRDVLGKVVDTRVAERLLASGEHPKLGGVRRNLAILVSDVRGFTTRTEHTEPEQLVADLNSYFTSMVSIVRDHGGVVDKFIGDGMLAVFGLDEPDCACESAVAAARDMLAALDALNRALSEPMRIGIGVHTGSVISGLIGSPERLEFTVIGDAVNTAARLESLTKEVGIPIVISQAVHDTLSQSARSAFKSLGTHPLKGKSNLVHVYGLSPE